MNKIGFSAEKMDLLLPYCHPNTSSDPQTIVPRKSLVQVHFPDRNTTLSYYNDRYDLHRGDLVYVEGKLEGRLGQVVDVTYHFKISLSDYKRVIHLVDTTVTGTFYMAGSHFITFDCNSLPYTKALTWFKAPADIEEEFVTGYDDESFPLNDLSQMKIKPEIANRGGSYYSQNRVAYLCIKDGCGHAIVEGSQPYEVEFRYQNGQISELSCTCPCGYNCKHEFAAMLQLEETLEIIEKHYSTYYEQSRCFAIIRKGDLFKYAVATKENGSFTL